MSYLQEQIEILKFDKRLLESNFRTGKITEGQYKEHLGALQDVESNSEVLVLSDGKQEEPVAEPAVTPNQAEQMGVAPGTPADSQTSGGFGNNDPFGSGY